MTSVAWLTAADGRIFFARAPRRGPDSLATAACRLVAGIQRLAGWDSLKLLRRRIYTTASASEFDARLVQVAAKRITFDADFGVDVARAADAAAVDLSLSPVGDGAADRAALLGGVGATFAPAEAVAACAALAASVPLEPDRFISSRPVGALVLDECGRLLAAAVNTNVVYRLHHAELNLVFNAFNRAPIPAGATVYTSLSPCRMCAALLARASADGSAVRVVSAALDPGRYGRQASVATTLWSGSNATASPAGT